MTKERWVIVPGKSERIDKSFRVANGMPVQHIVDEVRYPTVIFHVPEEFVRAWRENRP